MALVLKLYIYLFARPSLYNFNKFLYRCSLRGMGILNSADNNINGEIYFLKHLLKGRERPTALDVGANIGNFCQALVQACPNIQIHAFEPHPLTYRRLLENVSNLPVKCNNVAVGSTNEHVDLYDYAHDDASSHASLYREVIEKIHGRSSLSHRVHAICIDEYLENNSLDFVNLLKIDTEGHELSVLKGSKRSIEKGRIEAIQFEFNEMNTSSRTFLKDFLELLPQYDLYRLLPHGMLKIQRYNPLLHEIFAYQNIAAILRSIGVNQ